MQSWQQYSRVTNNTDAKLVAVQQCQQQHKRNIIVAQWLVGSNGQTSAVQQEMVQIQSDASVGYNTRVHSSLKGSVDFCSIGCALALRFCREVKTHAFSNTQKSFGKIPPRDDLIRIINFFLNSYLLNLKTFLTILISSRMLRSERNS